MITNAAASTAALRTARQRRRNDCLGVIDSLSPGEEEGFALEQRAPEITAVRPALRGFQR
jgi:hypothetical protein